MSTAVARVGATLRGLRRGLARLLPVLLKLTRQMTTLRSPKLSQDPLRGYAGLISAMWRWSLCRRGCRCAGGTARRSGLWSQADGSCRPLVHHIGQSSRLEAIAAAIEAGQLDEGSKLLQRLWRRSGGIGTLVEESAAARQVPQVHTVGSA